MGEETKTVKMDFTKKSEKTQEKANASEQQTHRAKLSYEELENTARQLDEQARTMYQELQKARLENYFTQLNFLFKVLDHPDLFPESFVKEIVDRIVGEMKSESNETKIEHPANDSETLDEQ